MALGYIDRGRHISRSFNVQDGGIALFPKKIMDRAAKYACFVGYVKFVLTICHKTVDSLDNVKWMGQESPVFLT